MPNVYIVNKGGHDHSDAKRYGILVYLSIGSINRYAVSEIYREFADKLYNSEAHDYILITGLSVMSSIACSIFSRMHGRLNLLLYRNSRDGEKGRYLERTIMIDELIRRKNETT